MKTTKERFSRFPLLRLRRQRTVLLHALAAMLALSILGIGPAQAQFIIDGTSLTVPPPLGNSPNTDLIVGNSTTGALTVEKGGTVTDLRGFIAVLSGSSGTVTVTGPGSTGQRAGLIMAHVRKDTLTKSVEW
jgi:hypothetical protein